MKYVALFPGVDDVQSPPAWVAWIEIQQAVHGEKGFLSPPAWVAWIEIKVNEEEDMKAKSPPAWVAWIEIMTS